MVMVSFQRQEGKVGEQLFEHNSSSSEELLIARRLWRRVCLDPTVLHKTTAS